MYGNKWNTDDTGDTDFVWGVDVMGDGDFSPEFNKFEGRVNQGLKEGCSLLSTLAKINLDMTAFSVSEVKAYPGVPQLGKLSSKVEVMNCSFGERGARSDEFIAKRYYVFYYDASNFYVSATRTVNFAALLWQPATPNIIHSFIR